VAANHTITAAYAINTYLITPTADLNGSITPGTPQTVNYGNSITFTIAANTGYHITDVRVDGVSQGVLSSYTFTNVAANHTITAAYAINTYLITPTADLNGSITPGTPQTVTYGSSITFTIAANTGYHITDVRVDGVSQSVLSSFTFTNVVANHIITSANAINTYLITPTSGANGSIIPGIPQMVNYGSSITFTIVPAGNYGIADVRVDDVPQSALGTYTFNNVSANHTITATFSLNCVLVSGVGFSYMPLFPRVGEVVIFTGTALGTTPITYSWDYGDGSAVDNGSPISHFFPLATIARSYTVTLTAVNACSSLPGVALVTISPYQVYLPVTIKN
jgi:hypothetical protein